MEDLLLTWSVEMGRAAIDKRTELAEHLKVGTDWALAPTARCHIDTCSSSRKPSPRDPDAVNADHTQARWSKIGPSRPTAEVGSK
jgi:hypothetical protein